MKLSAKDQSYFKTTASQNIPSAAIKALAQKIYHDDEWKNDHSKIVHSEFLGNVIFVAVAHTQLNRITFYKVFFSTTWTVERSSNSVNILDRQG